MSYTKHTYQDWEKAREGDRLQLLSMIISTYRSSDDFKAALMGQKYFRAGNDAVDRKKLLKPTKVSSKVKVTPPKGDPYEREQKSTRLVEVEGKRVYSKYFYRVVVQQNQHLLSNGVTLGDVGKVSGSDVKKRLGPGFDTTLSRMGENALCQGVCWGYWNLDHLEMIEAAKDEMSGFVALVDEETSVPRLGVQFWQLSAERPRYVRLFEEDGVTVYRTDENNNLVEVRQKEPYIKHILTDAMGEEVISGESYGVLPVIPLYANPERVNELDNSIKSKIDAYDCIASDFADNLDRANDVYWVLNNFGGTMEEVADMLEQIRQLQIVLSRGDGMGGASTAEPHTLEVPYQARKTALQILENSIYKDAMALSLEEITGGSLTNVAIRAATTNLNLKCDRYEWQVFAFVQQLLRLQGIETESISFVRQALVNQSETIADIDRMLDYIDDQTALELNPLIMPDQIPDILQRKQMQKYTGTPDPDIVTDDKEVQDIADADGEDDLPADDERD